MITRDQALYDRNRAFFEREYSNLNDRLASLETSTMTLVGSPETGDLNVDLGHTLFYDTDAVSFAAQQLDKFRRTPGQFFMNAPVRYDPPRYHQEYVAEDLYQYFGDRQLPQLPVNMAHDSGYLLIMGLGLGFHVPDLMAERDTRFIVIVEEFIEFLDLSFWFQDWPALHDEAIRQGRRFHFIFGDDPELVQSRLHWFMRGDGFGLIDGSYIFRHYTSMLMEATYKRFREELPLLPVSIGFWEDEMTMLQNCAANLLEHSSYLLDTMPRLERDAPVFIVGSGPSIDETIEIIRANRDKAIVFSCGTGLSGLLKHNIIPDFHCELENTIGSYNQLVHVQSQYGSLDKITLIAANTVYLKMPHLFRDSILFFRDSISSTALWAPNKSAVIYGAAPTVTNLGIRAALLMGFRQIYFFGVDLGTRNVAKRHSAASIYETHKEWAEQFEDKDRQWNIPMRANFGGMAYTNDILQWARMMMINSLDPFPSAKIYNCSDGVRITGTIPRLPETVALDVPLGRPQTVIAQVKASLAYKQKQTLIDGKTIEAVHAEFTDWHAEILCLVDRALEERLSFTRFYSDMTPLMWQTGPRPFQHVIRSVWVGSLMMMFQIGYYFWHRVPDHEQPALMQVFLRSFRREFKEMAHVAQGVLEHILSQCDVPN